MTEIGTSWGVRGSELSWRISSRTNFRQTVQTIFISHVGRGRFESRGLGAGERTQNNEV